MLADASYPTPMHDPLFDLPPGPAVALDRCVFEAVFVGRDGDTLDARSADRSDARSILEAAMNEVVETAGRVRAVASA